MLKLSKHWYNIKKPYLFFSLNLLGLAVFALVFIILMKAKLELMADKAIIESSRHIAGQFDPMLREPATRMPQYLFAYTILNLKGDTLHSYTRQESKGHNRLQTSKELLTLNSGELTNISVSIDKQGLTPQARWSYLALMISLLVSGLYLLGIHVLFFQKKDSPLYDIACQLYEAYGKNGFSFSKQSKENELQNFILKRIKKITDQQRAKIDELNQKYLAISHSEEKFKKAFELSPDSIILSKEEDGTILEVNDVFVKTFGYSRSECLNQTVADINFWKNPKDREEFIFLLDKLSLVTEMEYQFRAKTGSYKWCSLSSSQIKINGEKCLLTIARDITKRKYNEREFEQFQRILEDTLAEQSIENKRLISAIEQSNASIVMTDIKGHIEYVNPAFENHTGYCLDEVKGENPRILKSGLMPENIYDELWSSISSGKSWRGELINKKKDGNFFWEKAHISPIYTDGEISHYLAVKEDITEQKRVKDAMSSALQLNKRMASYTLKQTIDEGLEEAVQLTESHIGFFHFVDEDSGTISLQTWSKETLQNCSVPDRLEHYPIDKAGVWVDCIRQRQPIVHNSYKDLPHKRGLPQGHFPVTRQILVPVFEKEKIVAVIGCGNKTVDYTTFDLDLLGLIAENMWSIISRKKAETDLIKSKDEAEVLNNQLMRTLEQVKEAQSQLIQSEKMASLGVLTAGIAHEINNPINFVYSGVNSLEKDYQDLKQVIDTVSELNLDEAYYEQNLQRIQRLKEEFYFDELAVTIPQTIEDIKLGATRTADIIKGLRNFARTDNNIMEPTDVHQGLDSTLLLLKNKFKKKVSIHKDYDPALPQIEAYPSQLNQVFMNLINNAIDAVSIEGRIDIKTWLLAEKNSIAIRIHDNGSGIPRNIRKKIFDPFFSTKEVGEGMGLGLSISHGIIQKHQGKLKLTSSKTEGTSFTIILPIKP